MNIIKRLTAVTSLTVCIGILAPTTIVWAKTSSTNDSHMIKKNPESKSGAVGFGLKKPAEQTSSNENNSIFRNGLLQQGDAGSTVKKLQDALHALGYYNGSDNGVFGELTAAAVSSFQADQKITENSIVGTDTETAPYDVYRNTNAVRAYVQKLIENQKQEQRAAEAKVEAARAEQSSKAAIQKKAQEKRAPVVENVVYKPQPQKNTVQAGGTSQSLTVTATGYALSGTSATGIDFSGNPNAKVIAVDPSVIPLGSHVMIPGYGVYLAADTGGSITGNRIDIHFSNNAAALNFGVRTVTIQILH
ncbi:3D domain-containing protein [Sporolactobacillus pectinivorans]|uniref:3D domain-containing protein n=1 Tax=Sporolactobacillus pectinivorans TaxID=1591408 RepID=UPI000C26523F|nr:3D domain-containing protein [Sporolactobacillus pectinivorans]